MAQLSATISTIDPDFRASVIRLLRSSGLSISLTDDKHQSPVPPDLAVVDVRSGSSLAAETIERLRAAWPSASIFAVASTAEPDQILQAMRAGANEYLAWDQGDSGAKIDEAFHTALKRTMERSRPAKDSARSGVTL